MVSTCLANGLNTSFVSGECVSKTFWRNFHAAHPMSARAESVKSLPGDKSVTLWVGSATLREKRSWIFLIANLLASCSDRSLFLLPREAGCTWPPLLCVQRGIGCTCSHSRCSDSALSRTTIHQLRSQIGRASCRERV